MEGITIQEEDCFNRRSCGDAASDMSGIDDGSNLLTSYSYSAFNEEA
jgi:hypothetical protein